jgi:uncharacterized Zn-binding protein involved in type VI secretion
MPGICRDTTDTAGGKLNSTQTTVYAGGQLVIIDGDSVDSHGISLHDSPTMIAGSNKVYIGGVAVCNAGDLATCGDDATGYDKVNVGDPE